MTKFFLLGNLYIVYMLISNKVVINLIHLYIIIQFIYHLEFILKINEKINCTIIYCSETTTIQNEFETANNFQSHLFRRYKK